MTHKEKALALCEQKFHCSQAVLAAFAEECGLTEKQALKLGSCFGGGMRKGEVCGACAGALMVLGLLYGQDDKEDTASRETADAVNDRMMDGFAAVSGSYLCKELLKCDISTEEGADYAREHALFTEFCPQWSAATPWTPSTPPTDSGSSPNRVMPTGSSTPTISSSPLPRKKHR